MVELVTFQRSVSITINQLLFLELFLCKPITGTLLPHIQYLSPLYIKMYMHLQTINNDLNICV